MTRQQTIELPKATTYHLNITFHNVYEMASFALALERAIEVSKLHDDTAVITLCEAILKKTHHLLSIANRL